MANSNTGEWTMAIDGQPFGDGWTWVTFETQDIFPEKIIVNNVTTTVIWKDGTKTTVTCMEGNKFSVYDAIVQAYFKKSLGNNTKARKKWMDAAMRRVQYQQPRNAPKKK